MELGATNTNTTTTTSAIDTNMSNNNTNNNIIVTDSNGSSNGRMITTNSQSGPPQAGNGPISLKAGYDTDVVRLIGQHLISLGLKKTVDILMEESGLSAIDHPVASRFRKYILDGDWDRAIAMIDEMASHSEGDKQSNIREMRLKMAEQKFLESLEDGDEVKALKCLRQEITPLSNDDKYVKFLANLLICKSDQVRLYANWPGKGLQSRQNLVEKFARFIPPLIMLPPRRLSTLLSQAVQLQKERCTLHINKSKSNNNENLNSDQPIQDEYIDLKTDHICTAENFPLHTRQEFDSHKTEVWFCKFSNDGKKLATGGLGGKIKIWDVDPNTKKLKERSTLDSSCHSITCLSWSPNDVYLLACGGEDRPDLWVWNVHKEEVHNQINHSDDEGVTTCSWHLSGEKFAAASSKGNFTIYDLDGNRRGSREGVRVQCLSFLHKDPSIILAADTLRRIKSYAIKDMSLETDEEDIIEERHSIMSFTVDKEDHYIAVNLLEQGVHLWDFRLKTLLRMFPGVCQRNFTIHSSFSSPETTFLASGSEDGKVYIYHVHKDKPVAVLHGHSRCVNCVSWNPVFPELLVSVSDDRAVRLWGPPDRRLNQQGLRIKTDNDIKGIKNVKEE